MPRTPHRLPRVALARLALPLARLALPRARLALPLALGGLLLLPSQAEARPDRRGFQSDFTIGVAGCVPYRAQCTSDDIITGRTGPSMGLGVTLGLRPIKPLMVGAAYNFGLFNPKYSVAGADDVYRVAYQNSLFAVIRPILPIWRFDLGLEIGGGWSRQTFRHERGSLIDRESSQGFAMKVGPVIDFFITKHFFLGAKVDFIFNFHGDVCTESTDGTRVCQRSDETDQASVHQVIAGVHLGTVF